MRITFADLKTRLQIAKEVLKYRDYNGQVMTCGNCGSTYIKQIKYPTKIKDSKNEVHYRSQFVCENCGCRCVETQEWKVEKE